MVCFNETATTELYPYSHTLSLHDALPIGRSRGRCARPRPAAVSAPRNDPDSVHDAGDVAEDRQQDVQPEVKAAPNLEEYAHRRQQDGEDDADRKSTRLNSSH